MIKTLASALAGCFCTLVLAACDGGVSAPQANNVPQSPAAVTTHPADEAKNPDPAFDWGYTVQITNVGFHPMQLVAPCCQTVVWKNLTLHTVVVDFPHLYLKSDPIPPNGTWGYLPKGPQAIAYSLETEPGASAMSGSVIVQQTAQE